MSNEQAKTALVNKLTTDFPHAVDIVNNVVKDKFTETKYDIITINATKLLLERLGLVTETGVEDDLDANFNAIVILLKSQGYDVDMGHRKQLTVGLIW